MQRLLIIALVAGGGYYAWVEYGGGPGITAPASGSGGAGFSSFGTAAGNVAAGAKAAVR